MRHTIHLLALAPLSLLLVPQTQGQLRLRSRYILSPTEVARAISHTLTSSDVTASLPTVLLLADVSASEPNPQLDIDIVSPLRMTITATHAPQRIVRVTCHAAGVCLPFYAVITWTANELPAEFSLVAEKKSPTDTQRLQPTMRSGEHATLILESRGARLEVPVVSLQSGAEGQSVRAISLDHKHIYTANVIAATVLKGSF